ncbi:ParB/RepB/Spo0J family partition protein [Conexibacter woesei]|uniref:ParB/RepB/Spo0J family partition protein n=1 Tax=Conexibacter woesei TaxID=191495 RepID=UPI0003F6906F|nr:ParB/RepB/Spo0J family partition protein [Conexibacter woesei]
MAERGMGRGLSAILSASSAPAAGTDQPGAAQLRELALDQIRPNKDQPRRRFDEEKLQALAESVQDRGVIQPVIVRPKPGGTFELVAGERRWRAAKLAGLTQMPALVQDHDDATTLEVALVENMARQDLNPVEEARAVAGLVEELGLTREAVGKKVGRSRVAISNLLRLLDLPDEALDLLEDGTLSEGHGRAILLAEDQVDRKRLARAAAGGGWSVRVTEDQARKANEAASDAGHSGGARAIHPDQAAAATEIADALGGALGIELKVKPRGTGYRVELAFDSLDDALAVAQRVSDRR